jgi:hypothetical protein
MSRFLTNNISLSNSDQTLSKYINVFTGSTLADASGALVTSKLNFPYNVTVDIVGNIYIYSR